MYRASDGDHICYGITKGYSSIGIQIGHVSGGSGSRSDSRPVNGRIVDVSSIDGECVDHICIGDFIIVEGKGSPRKVKRAVDVEGIACPECNRVRPVIGE